MSDDFVRSFPAVTNCFFTGPRSNFTPGVYNSPENKVAGVTLPKLDIPPNFSRGFKEQRVLLAASCRL